MNAHQIEAQRWFKQAQSDLAVVQTLRAARYYAAACFHAQQAAEKALKAILFSQGQRMVWGHSVRSLIKQCQVYDPALAPLAGDAALLDQFYIPTRYPNGLPLPAVPSETYTLAEADAAHQAAENILRAVETFLRTHTSVFHEPEEQ